MTAKAVIFAVGVDYQYFKNFDTALSIMMK